MRIAILGSTRGTHLLNLHQAIVDARLNATIAIVISNKADAVILQRAEQFNIPSYHVDGDKAEQENKIHALLSEYRIDLVLLAGYMRILSPSFVNRWQNKIINVHPSLLPDFAGMMDLNVHRAVLAAEKKVTGCTVHFVDDQVDSGEILLQKTVAVLPDDTAETLKSRVQAAEANALIEAINQLSDVC